MTTETTAGAETAGGAATGDTEAQLDQMRAAESGTEEGAQKTKAEPAAQAAEETTEVKDKTEKVVPLAALHEERNARKELQRQLAERDRKQAERDALIDRRLAALQPKEQQAQVPDREQDAVGYLDHRINEVMQTIKPVVESQEQAREQRERERVVNELANVVVASRDALRAEKPDVEDAATHLDAVRTRELMALGMPESQARQRASFELNQALIQWAHEGRDPARVAYDFALARGYTPKAAAAQAAAVQQPTAQEKLAAQQRGVKAATSLGGGGAVNSGKLTAAALAEMSDEDFSKLTEAQFRQAMGG